MPTPGDPSSRFTALAYLLLGEMGDASTPLNFSNSLGDRLPPPTLGGDFLGEGYKGFGHAVAILFFVSPKKKVSFFSKFASPPLKNPRNVTGLQGTPTTTGK